LARHYCWDGPQSITSESLVSFLKIPHWNCTMPFPSEERPDPSENMPAMRARIPDHIARGEISTGVIVVTGGTEYLLDFVRNLPRPNAIVARVILPHMVMPQFIDALAANVELFRNRYGELPGAPSAPAVAPVPPPMAHAAPSPSDMNSVDILHGLPSVQPSLDQPPGMGSAGASGSKQPSANSTNIPVAPGNISNGGVPSSGTPNSGTPNHGSPSGSDDGQGVGGTNPNLLKRQNPQEVYDDLKLRDEILSGAYANAVMIGHGPYEFSFDFITNFYPQSAVSCRVYLASGHIHRLLESLRASWEQLRPRLNQQFPPQPPQPPRNHG
jgi:hypothetical protein